MGLPASFPRCEAGEPKQGNLCYFCKDWWGGNNGAVCKGQSLCNHTFCMGESHFCDRGNKGVTGRWQHFSIPGKKANCSSSDLHVFGKVVSKATFIFSQINPSFSFLTLFRKIS